MTINYCLPIIKKSKSEVLETIDQNRSEFSFFEVWLDYIEDLDIEFIEKLSDELGEKLIFLLRRQNLEQIQMSLQKRHTIMQLLSHQKSLLDLDIRQQDELHFLKEQSLLSPLILSYHNYGETPQKEVLRETIESMREYKPAIYKIATFCKTKKEAVRLLDLLVELKDQSLRCIILGMGELGTVTRIFGTLWGNELVFAPLEKTASSAPGQLTKEELEKIFSTIS